ncbi:flagellar hook-length control protein FliK [Planctomycetaceae bacterium SH139]
MNISNRGDQQFSASASLPVQRPAALSRWQVPAGKQSLGAGGLQLTLPGGDLLATFDAIMQQRPQEATQPRQHDRLPSDDRNAAVGAPPAADADREAGSEEDAEVAESAEKSPQNALAMDEQLLPGQLDQAAEELAAETEEIPTEEADEQDLLGLPLVTQVEPVVISEEVDEPVNPEIAAINGEPTAPLDAQTQVLTAIEQREAAGKRAAENEAAVEGKAQDAAGKVVAGQTLGDDGAEEPTAIAGAKHPRESDAPAEELGWRSAVTTEADESSRTRRHSRRGERSSAAAQQQQAVDQRTEELDPRNAQARELAAANAGKSLEISELQGVNPTAWQGELDAGLAETVVPRPGAAAALPVPPVSPLPASGSQLFGEATKQRVQASAAVGDAAPTGDSSPGDSRLSLEAGTEKQAAAAGKKATAAEGSEASGNLDRIRLVQRVSRAFQRIGPSGGHVNLMLHPAELGSVQLNLKVDGRKLAASITTQTSAAMEVLREHLPELRQRLADFGMELEQIHFEVARDGEAHERGGDFRQAGDFQQAGEQQRNGAGWRERADLRRQQAGQASGNNSGSRAAGLGAGGDVAGQRWAATTPGLDLRL